MQSCRESEVAEVAARRDLDDRIVVDAEPSLDAVSDGAAHFLLDLFQHGGRSLHGSRVVDERPLAAGPRLGFLEVASA